MPAASKEKYLAKMLTDHDGLVVKNCWLLLMHSPAQFTKQIGLRVGSFSLLAALGWALKRFSDKNRRENLLRSQLIV
jgi:hypothetical protein